MPFEVGAFTVANPAKGLVGPVPAEALVAVVEAVEAPYIQRSTGSTSSHRHR